MNFRQNGDKYLITIEVIALIVVLVFGAVHFVMPGNKSNKKITESQQETQNPTQETDGTKQVQVDGQQTAPAFTPSDSVKTKLSSMTTEEKVAQLFITRPEEITGVSEFTQAGNKTKAAIGTYPLGGFVFRQENFSGEAAVTKMMSSLQSFSQERLGVNLFLAIDEEGGTVSRLSSNKNILTNPFLSSQEIYKNKGFDGIRDDTINKSKILYELGINLNLAPVADVSINEDDYIFKRSFGKNADLTSKYIETVISNTDYKVSYTLKHFPGYGNNKDTHKGIAIDDRTYSSFEQNDFLPFIAGIKRNVNSILFSHNYMNCVDKINPASLSPNVHNILKNLNFNNIMITDDISMNGLKDVEDKYLKAVLAGNNLLIVTDFKEAYNEILNAYRDKKISDSMINYLVLKNISWKYYKKLNWR